MNKIKIFLYEGLGMQIHSLACEAQVVHCVVLGLEIQLAEETQAS